MAVASIVLFLSCLHAAAGSDPLPTPAPLGNLIDLGGYRVHLYCTGEGSPTVVIVGGAFSFDWGLVQPEVAKLTRICTYDPSGTAWSDPYRSKDHSTSRCDERVAEIHAVLQKGGVSGPYILVGFSIGGLMGRLYVDRYPKEVAGMMIVDHAFIDVASDGSAAIPVATKPVPPKASAADSPPVLIYSQPISLGVEDDENFRKLPQRNRDLHAWAMSKNPFFRRHKWRRSVLH